MSPHNSLHTVSDKIMRPGYFSKHRTVFKDHVFVLKKKTVQEIGDEEEMTARPFPCFSVYREGTDGLLTAGQQELPGGLADGALLLYFVREVYSAVVCGQCV